MLQPSQLSTFEALVLESKHLKTSQNHEYLTMPCKHCACLCCPTCPRQEHWAHLPSSDHLHQPMHARPARPMRGRRGRPWALSGTSPPMAPKTMLKFSWLWSCTWAIGPLGVRAYTGATGVRVSGEGHICWKTGAVARGWCIPCMNPCSYQRFFTSLQGMLWAIQQGGS